MKFSKLKNITTASWWYKHLQEVRENDASSGRPNTFISDENLEKNEALARKIKELCLKKGP